MTAKELLEFLTVIVEHNEGDLPIYFEGNSLPPYIEGTFPVLRVATLDGLEPESAPGITKYVLLSD